MVFCTQGVGVLLKKWYLLLSKRLGILLLFLIITAVFCGCTYAEGKFIELNFRQQDNNQPVVLNENEIFFPGGTYSNDSKCYNSAKIYNIKEHKLIDTTVSMNVPRYNYGAIKYDNNNILIVGGLCSDNSKKTNSCSQVAEIYNIKDKKFTQISNTNLKYAINIHTISLKDGNVFILSGGNFEVFNPLNKKFSIIVNKRQHISNLHKYCTINNFSHSNILQINPIEILIYGTRPLNTVPNKELFAMEIFNLETRTSTNIPVDYNKLNYINIGSPIKINNKTILFVGAGKDKKDVVKFDINSQSFDIYNRLSSPLSDNGFLLTNGKVLFVRGGLFKPDYIKGTSLEHAVYDYKNNKVYNYKTTHKLHYTTHFVNINNNTIYISGYKNEYPMLYKY